MNSRSNHNQAVNPSRSPANSASPAPEQSWHTMTAEQARAQLQVAHPLSDHAAASKRALYGPNQLPERQASSPWARLGRQLRNFLIYVLLGAVAITAALGHWVDAGVIMAVVVIQTLVGFIQEGKAEQALSAIRHMLAPKARVIRENGQQQLDASQLVPGDTVLLEAGDRVPADIRLEKCHNLRVDEAILTGESQTVEKSHQPVGKDSALGDQTSMAFSGTMVATGTGCGVVVRTGASTEIGRISGLLASTTSLKTPLLEQMDGFARILSLVVIAAGVAILVSGLTLSGLPFPELFMAVVGLTVAAIPEGLPAILTITLAIGVREMARRKAVVRRMPVIESLGAVSVICSDKTGTLTRNEMMVTTAVQGRQRWDVTGEGYSTDGQLHHAGQPAEAGAGLQELARAAALCNDAHLDFGALPPSIQGDPMEAALKVFTHKAAFDIESGATAWPRKDEIPFDTQTRFMATLNHDHHGHSFIFVKGAPERILDMCVSELTSNAAATALDRGWWDDAIATMASEGLRVLALARKPVPRNTTDLAVEDLNTGVELLGVVGLLDPPRQEAIRAIADCHDAGIRVKMITGDHALTAGAIARKLGLKNTGQVLTGKDLDGLSAQALQQLASEVDVFARTSPEHKLRLVEALQASHGVVAMTGDGVNDAPALKRADVGIAMGVKGSEAAREASSVVLLDDNFASIAAAVREGRTVYTNLKKAIAFMLPINGGESISLVIALLLGLALPISALQILWVNMVSSVVLAMTLAFEPAEPDIMKRPPRPRSEPLLRGFLVWRVVFVSLVFLTGIFSAWFWAMHHHADQSIARTLSVNTLIAMEVFYLFAVRYLDTPSLTLRGVLGTPVVLAAVATVAGLQLLFTYLPWFQALFGTSPLSWEMLVFAGLAGVCVLIILEIETWIRSRLWPDRRQSPLSRPTEHIDSCDRVL
ncbi:MAG: HAD-IC family P-type ATPase [Marinobacter sp.]|uniref:cation-translocating P-type ATPase n=1 Tax=Marinobacter sp. TaxID=50741 RepID=UPI00299E6136|nr:HAD-IC family P-type ATPase [Marinobacter sp.]MDX1633753.1 HAD-IC family P-type ATPase [Marinobacter sp.]